PNDSSLDKIPPQNLDAEMAVLGSMLIDEEAIATSVEILDKNFFYKDSETVKNLLQIQLKCNDRTDETYLLLNEKSSPRFDGGCDALKLSSLNPSVPLIYTVSEDLISLAINSIPLQEGEVAIPAGVRLPVSGEALLVTSGISDFDPSIGIILEDLKSGVKINLKENPEYLFQGDPGDEPLRFVLRFSDVNGVSESDLLQKARIFSYDHQVVVIPVIPEIPSRVEIYNMIGQMISSENFRGQDIIKIPVMTDPEICLVRVFNGNHVMTAKAFIR
ncbi:MAG: DnaB-like helicase N-terminal domain-containing protein, partial [Bacteroidota bacterium]